MNQADYKSRDIGQLSSDLIAALGGGSTPDPAAALTLIKQILDGTTFPSVFKKQFTNGTYDNELELIRTLAVNDGANNVSTIAQLLKMIKDGQIDAESNSIAFLLNAISQTTSNTNIFLSQINTQVNGSSGILEFVDRNLTGKVLVGATGGNGVYYLTGINVYNPNASTVFLKFYDAATTGGVTVGTTGVNYMLPVPPYGSVVFENPLVSKKAFPTGIVITAITTYDDAGVANPATGLYVSNLQFKFIS